MKKEKVKILIVDDDPFARAMLVDILESGGYRVETAKDGLDGLRKYEEFPDIVLILSDMNMARMNGLELVKAVRKKDPAIPMIILTVNKEISIALEAIRSGASDYLLKDENIDETLFISIEKVLEKHQLKEQNQQLMNTLSDKNEELEKSNRALIELNQQKNKLLGIAAHDIRGPVGMIIGLTAILANELKKNATEKQKQYLKMITDTSEGMVTLINNLLDVSVIKSGKLKITIEPGDMQKLLEERIAIAGFTAEKKEIRITRTFSDVPLVLMDSIRISQVIDNLISNAIKYSPFSSTIEVLLRRKGDMVYVGIKDQGPGIPENEHSRLFGEFERLSPRPTGGEKSTGLGLAIVKKIIESHNGNLKVESRTGDGSTFGFELMGSI